MNAAPRAREQPAADFAQLAGTPDYTRAVLNILEDAAEERTRLQDAQRAVVNILEDAAEEKLRLEEMQKSVLNILEDLAGELSVRTGVEQQMRISLQEKEVLLQEIHHRVKNNLQIIASLLSLQSGYIRDPQMLMQFQESQGRIRSMALIHEKLYQSETLGRVDLADYVQSLVNMLMRTYTANAGVKSRFNLGPTSVSIDTAVPVGLMLNELVTNALKYAFPNGRPGCLTVRMATDADGGISLHVEDDGIGLPADFVLDQASTLGLRLVRMFAKQLRAEVVLASEPGHTAFAIQFKEAAAPPS